MGTRAAAGFPQHTGLGAHPWLCVSPESRAGSVLDFRVVETGPTFLRLAWQPGPEPPQGYSLSYTLQGEGTVLPGCPVFAQPRGLGRTWQGGAWQGVCTGGCMHGG